MTKGRRREGRAKGKEGVEAESQQINTLDWRRKDDRPSDKEKGKSKKGGQEKIVYMATDTKQIKTLAEDSQAKEKEGCTR